MKKIYTDASFDWNSTNQTTENIVRGKVAISDGDKFNQVDKVAIGKVAGLKQYNNIFELTAIARAIELASEFLDKEIKSIEIITDSQTAKYWACAGKIKNKKIETEAHRSAIEYLKKAYKQFAGEVIFSFIPRGQNPAGKLLEIELEKEAPHTI